MDFRFFWQLALEQADQRLLAGVCLSEHRGSSLLEDLEASELAALGSNIDINDAAVRGFKVGSVDAQEVLSEVDAAHFRAVLSAHISQVLQSKLGDKCMI